MELKTNGSQPPSKGPSEYFTGNVRIDPLFSSPVSEMPFVYFV